MTRRFGVVLFLAILAASPVWARDDDGNIVDDTPHVTIVGAAHADVVPDVAEINLGASVERPGAAEAMAETSRITAAVIGAAKAQGISMQDINTQNVTLTQTFDTLKDVHGAYGGQKPRGFEANNTIAIRVRALDKAGALAQSLIDKGATQFNGIRFYSEHPEPVMDRLYAEAVRDAKRRAAIVAEALGVKLGRILLIERPGQTSGGIAPLGLSRVAAAPAPTVPFEAGIQTLTMQMEVTWALD